MGNLRDRNVGDTDYSTSNLPTSESGLAHSIASAGGGGCISSNPQNGSPNIWILDPGRSKAYRYESGTVLEVHDRSRSADSSVTIQLRDILQ